MEEEHDRMEREYRREADEMRKMWERMLKSAQNAQSNQMVQVSQTPASLVSPRGGKVPSGVEEEKREDVKKIEKREVRKTDAQADKQTQVLQPSRVSQSTESSQPTQSSDLESAAATSSQQDSRHERAERKAMRLEDEVESEMEEGRTRKEEKFTLLMVDDSPDMCRFVHDYFRADYQVLTAYNGEQALEVLEKNEDVDLVVSDVTMPKMDGMELCRRVKSDLRWSHIPVILVTGRRTEDAEIESLKLGADDYITKPFNVEMLRLRVKKLIEKQNDRQRKFREKADVAASDITITPMDAQFIEKAISICEEHIEEQDFSVEAFGRELGLSRTHLYKKMTNITGKGPAEFIRTIKLKKGKHYLETTSWQIAEVAGKLGYSNPKRFTENFKAEFGLSPSEYAKKMRG